MNKRLIITALTGLFAIIITTYSCTKLDTTTLGTDVIPVVDNINTFADTLDISSTQGFFNDSSTISNTDDHALGKIENDDLFGKTDASVFLLLKPRFFPYYLGQANDTVIGVDSVVLSLKYRGFYGDSTIPQTLQVEEVSQTQPTGTLWDSVYRNRPVSFEPQTTGAILGTKTIDIRELKNLVKFGNNKDSDTYQIRIKLSQSWANNLLSQDSTTNGINNGFFNDSIFSKRNRGLGVRSVSGGNALMYVNLQNAGTRLEIHFRKRRNNIVDTVFSTFIVQTSPSATIKPSVTANHIIRDRSSGTYPPTGVPSDQIYLQTTPGTFGLLTIPRLSRYKDTNRVVHRAEIYMEQVPGNFITDSLFTAPNFLYLDLKDSTSALNYKPVYYDLNPGYSYNPDNTTNYYPLQVDYGYFGGYLRRRTDLTTGRNIAYYNFNVTRYIQKMCINHSYNYSMRLFSPFSINYPQYGKTVINYANSMAFGRVRIGGGTNLTHKMKMVVIWSKIK